ncbi:MAG: hypothetical protein PHN18_09365 [Sulfurospirillaceae bacterium]|nr:hypothetical protein [Sulfurospirillaceae bacterium]MDD2827147.1 hypothetical protein [Sulfurospirillaceae bacterium]
MKKTFSTAILIGFPLVVLITLGWYLAHRNQSPTDIINQEQKPLTYKDNTVQCPQCHMYLVGMVHTAQIISKEGQTHFFDDIGCAILWSKEHHIDVANVVFWVYTVDTKRWIKAKEAHYSLNDETPMKYGFGAYEQEKEGMIAFEEMRLRMLRGENMSDPKVRKKLLGK